jgi:hypothetical protein
MCIFYIFSYRWGNRKYWGSIEVSVAGGIPPGTQIKYIFICHMLRKQQVWTNSEMLTLRALPNNAE